MSHLPAWSLVLGDKPHGQPKDWANKPVFVVCKCLNFPVACWRSGLASVLGKAYALHGFIAGTCNNTEMHVDTSYHDTRRTHKLLCLQIKALQHAVQSNHLLKGSGLL